MESIWQLLHAEGRQWDIDRIGVNLPQLFVLVYGTKIIGTLCGKISSDKWEVDWIVSHPLFPENPIAIILFQALSEIYIRRLNY